MLKEATQIDYSIQCVPEEVLILPWDKKLINNSPDSCLILSRDFWNWKVKHQIKYDSKTTPAEWLASHNNDIRGHKNWIFYLQKSSAVPQRQVVRGIGSDSTMSIQAAVSHFFSLVLSLFHVAIFQSNSLLHVGTWIRVKWISWIKSNFDEINRDLITM